MEKKPRRLKIAYYSKNDPLDKRSWSGTTYYLGQALQKHVGEVDFLGPVVYPAWYDKIVRGVVKFCRVFLKSNYLAKYSLLQNWYAARYLQRKMKGKQYDFIFAVSASPELGLLKTNVPIVYMCDTTYKQYSTYNQKVFENHDRFSKWEGEYLEKLSLKKSACYTFTSKWAAQFAIDHYRIEPRKVSVIPLGANMDHVPDRRIIYEKEKNPVLTLLFLAVEWEYKGGPIALEALKHLLSVGIDAKLIVCGVVPPPQYAHPCMEVIPFLNKNKKEDHKRFIELLTTSHFLLLPTRSDCSSLTACEANAFGMPSITTDTGGVSAIVKNGVNGYCLPFEAGGVKYAECIANIYKDKGSYHKLIESSRTRFENVLNWDKWAEQFNDFYHMQMGKDINVDSEEQQELTLTA